MHNTVKLSDSLTWIGGNDRRVRIFEGAYPIRKGMSYNSYLLTDGMTVLLDTVDKAVSEIFFENLEYALGGRPLDRVIVSHMEPDHSATLGELIRRHPETRIITNSKTVNMIRQFFDFDVDGITDLVNEGDVIDTGSHELTFINAPMVHWPEVMFTYDRTDRVLFSADAFGSFGAIDGGVTDDVPGFSYDHYLPEARRYYANIVGKYGAQVKAVLGKAAALDIDMICPLHGVIWHSHIKDIVGVYSSWASYEPERKGVVIAYGSVYGNSANAAEILATKLASRGIETAVFDLSVTHPSEVLAKIFEYDRFVIASATVDGGMFSETARLMSVLGSHNVSNRTAAVIDNGTWAPMAGRKIREHLESLKNVTIVEPSLSIKSSLTSSQEAELDALADALM